MKKTKILIVEDEIIVALDIKKALEVLDFEITAIAKNYAIALESVKKEKPHIILMDINLKNSKSGIETAEAIQKIENIPIIYLTAYSDETTLQKAIRTNPISYLLKPFKRDELKSTILLGLYKINQSNRINIETNCINLGFNYYYDVKNKLLFYDNIPIKLSQNEKKLLNILVEAKGAIVSFREIEYYIWPDYAVTDSTLRTLLYRLRSKLEYKIVETIPSFGCKITPIF